MGQPTTRRDRRVAVAYTRTAVAYCRVSTNLTRQDLGAEAQRAAIEQWAERNGVTIASWFVEEVSGGASLDKRPVLLEALGAVAAHDAGLLVVQRLDRFSRDPLTAALAEAELQRHGATLAVADGAGGGTDPTSELVRGILFSVARFEKAMIKARIRAALAVKKTRGELTGKAPFGFRVASDGKTLEPDDRESLVIERVRAMKEEGATLRDIQAAAHDEHLLGRTGKPLTLPAIHAIVKRTAA